MTTSSRALLYDLFKLIVAIVLLLLFLFLWIWMRPAQTHQAELIPATFTVSPPTLSTTLIENPPTVSASSTSAPPTQPPPPSATSLPTITLQPAPTFTPIPSPTELQTPEALLTPTAEISEETNACEAASHSQLQAGMKATIVRYLNFRSSPGILNNWILTNVPGTRVEIIGGPECTLYQSGGSYLWWQIKLPNGQVGWSAEGSAFGKFYFMEPAP